MRRKASSRSSRTVHYRAGCIANGRYVSFAVGLGVIEICIAILIALRPWSRKASAFGSAAAVLMFLTALSFLYSTTGWEPGLGGFPALSGAVGQFLINDVALLGAAIWSVGKALIPKEKPTIEP
jgi:reactive chlorine resistance protein C